MKLQTQHLALLLQLQSWAPPCNQANMPAPHPGVLTDLFDCELLDRDADWQVVLTDAGTQAVRAAVEGMRATARQMSA